MPDLKQALKDFVATSNSGKYKDDATLLSKFPELNEAVVAVPLSTVPVEVTSTTTQIGVPGPGKLLINCKLY